jgi:AcrR family transcriptional regulator
MPRPKQRTPELRAQMLQRALALLAEEGVGAFTARNVARAAQTSPPALYELFGDRAGLLREVFFEGFRLLRAKLAELPHDEDPRAELVALVALYREFVRARPVLAQLMFARPFADFDPDAAELEAGAAVRRFIVGRVRRAVAAGQLRGDATDLAHVLVALTQGLVAAENAGRLGRSRAAVERRWRIAVEAMLDGLGGSA